MSKDLSVNAYNNSVRAEDYNKKTGFDPSRKTEMLDVTLDSIIDLTKSGSHMLELGAGSGLFTNQLIETKHFNKIYVTDGADSMLKLAKNNLQREKTTLQFDRLNFTGENWSKQYESADIEVVTSSMALHHAEHKQILFHEVFNVLNDNGVFVFADHVSGTTQLIDRLIGTKRARIKNDTNLPIDDEEVVRFISKDNEKQAAEGNACESVSSYLNYLEAAGFIDVDCIWRDYWLAVFIARKPKQDKPG